MSIRWFILFPIFVTFCFKALTVWGQNSTLNWQAEPTWRGTERPLIRNITLTGNKEAPTKKLRSILFSREQSWLSTIGLTKKNRLQKDSRVRDLASLYAYYRTHGYLDVEIDERFAWDSTRNRVDILLEIKEGRSTTIASVGLTGDTLNLSRKLGKIINEIVPGQPFNPYLLQRVYNSIKALYADNGFPFAKVGLDTIRTPDSSALFVNFRIDRNGLVYFGTVTYEGLKFTQTDVVKRELSFAPGDLYSQAKIISSQQRIYSTGLFSYVNLASRTATDKQTGDASEHADFLLRVVERKPAFVGLKTGAGQFQQQEQQQDLVIDLGAQWGYRNLWGTGRKINLQIKTSFLVVTRFRMLNNKVIAEYVEPWLLGSRTQANFGLAFEPGIKSAVFPYRIQTITGSLGLVREISVYTRLFLTGLFQHVNIYGISPENLTQFKKDQGISIRRRLIFSLDKDTRDNIFLPRAGSQTTAAAELTGGPLGGDADFVKFTFSWARYRQLSGSNVFAVRFKYGLLEGLKVASYVPSTDRFFLGGAASLRGYPENNVGPKTPDGQALGGRTILLFNGELRRPLFWKFWGSLFADVGNIWNEPAQLAISELRITTGVGIQYLTPIGPIRLDYAQRVIRATDRAGGRLHLSILYAF